VNIGFGSVIGRRTSKSDAAKGCGAGEAVSRVSEGTKVVPTLPRSHIEDRLSAHSSRGAPR